MCSFYSKYLHHFLTKNPHIRFKIPLSCIVHDLGRPQCQSLRVVCFSDLRFALSELEVTFWPRNQEIVFRKPLPGALFPRAPLSNQARCSWHGTKIQQRPWWFSGSVFVAKHQTQQFITPITQLHGPLKSRLHGPTHQQLNGNLSKLASGHIRWPIFKFSGQKLPG